MAEKILALTNRDVEESMYQASPLFQQTVSLDFGNRPN
jgi:hypothetical protein